MTVANSHHLGGRYNLTTVGKPGTGDRFCADQKSLERWTNTMKGWKEEQRMRHQQIGHRDLSEVGLHHYGNWDILWQAIWKLWHAIPSTCRLPPVVWSDQSQRFSDWRRQWSQGRRAESTQGASKRPRAWKGETGVLCARAGSKVCPSSRKEGIHTSSLLCPLQDPNS